MDDWLRERVRATPDAAALIIGSERWSYGRLDEIVEIAAQGLTGHVQKGDRVAVLLPNNLDFVCLIHAIARVGAILVPLNSRLSAIELAWQINHANCCLLIHDGQADELLGAIGLAESHVMRSEDLLKPGPVQDQATYPLFDFGNIQAIVFTSGTTGMPKGAMLTYANHYFSATSSAFRLGLHPDDIWLCCLPLYHVGGLAILLRSCLYGTAVDLHDGFDVSRISMSLDTNEITLLSLVPTMLHRLLRHHDKWPLSNSLRRVLLGGAAVPVELLAECAAKQIPVSLTYGLTEAASQVATAQPEKTMAKPGCVGKPLLFTSVKILSEGQELKSGEIGEIVLSGPTVMAGYDQDKAATENAVRQGWLYTGDIGYLDDDSDLWVLQRRSDIIISGGENVYPAEIEAMLRRHPLVLDACVIGIEDNEWGQIVAAAIASSASDRLSIGELETICRQNLGGYKIPRRFLLLPALPQTASGKIHRQAVADLFTAENSE